MEEQATLLSGDGWWNTHAIARVGLPAITMCDGPHGLRRAKAGHSASTGESELATCFPTASAMGATWNVALQREVARAIALEAQADGRQIVLGPGVNIKRSPLGGRNFEYFSEDPWLSGRLAVAFIQGMQAQGVGTSLKHFAANSQEAERMVSDSQIDERTLHEIYLPAFEMAVREAQPWTVMSAYNLVNGQYASEHPGLLTDILRRRWGFKGFVVSDWGAIHDRVAAVAAGNNLEMPGSGTFNRQKILAAVQEGRLAPATLAQSATELVRVVLMADAQRRPQTTFDVDAHHALARRTACEAIVLLQNNEEVLPLRSGQRVAIIGEYARSPRYQGAGSSHVNPFRVTNALEELALQLGSEQLLVAEGFGVTGEASAEQIREAAVQAARADMAIVFAGLPDSYESEAFDRTSIDLPSSQNRLITEVARAQPRTVVVLHNGSAVAMPWADQVQGIVEAWLGGQAGGAAVADILTGRVNPSGKLAETFPSSLAQTATFSNFPGRQRQAVYSEGLFVGYRHADAKQLTPLFPFGFGLSYTTFALVSITSTTTTFDTQQDDALHIDLRIRNVGARAGQEVVQLYLHSITPTRPRPPNELRGFEKVLLMPGEERTVTFTLRTRDFAHYDPDTGDWRVDDGQFELRVGNSSRHLPLSLPLTVRGAKPTQPRFTRMSLIGDFLQAPDGDALYARLVRGLGFGSLIDETEPPAGLLPQEVQSWFKRRSAMLATADALPVCKLPALSEGRLDDDELDEILRAANP